MSGNPVAKHFVRIVIVRTAQTQVPYMDEKERTPSKDARIGPRSTMLTAFTPGANWLRRLQCSCQPNHEQEHLTSNHGGAELECWVKALKGKEPKL